MKTKISKDFSITHTTMRDMQVGQLARVTDPDEPAYHGMVVLRTFNGIISLTDPGTVWSGYQGEELPTIQVHHLPIGAEVVLTQE